jgi:hypothetical protein
VPERGLELSVVFPDDQIEKLLREPKPLPGEYRARLSLRQKRGHRVQDMRVQGAEGHEFHILLRQSSADPLDFSVILGVTVPGTNRVFRLRRYNGKSHRHSNRLEGEPPFYDFHIHCATRRYQEGGSDEEAYAERTDRFADLSGALNCLLADCGFILPTGEQLALFQGRAE